MQSIQLAAVLNNAQQAELGSFSDRIDGDIQPDGHKDYVRLYPTLTRRASTIASQSLPSNRSCNGPMTNYYTHSCTANVGFESC